MGNAWSTFKQRRDERKRKTPYYVISASERDDIMRKKAQMEEQINALNKQIYKEKAAWVTTRNTPLLHEEIARIAQTMESAKMRHDTTSEILKKYGHWNHCPTCSQRVYLKGLDKLKAP